MNAKRKVRGIRADWLRRKDFMEFELGTKCRDEIPDTASANIDSPSVLNSKWREQCAEPGFSEGPRDRNINVPCTLRCCTNCGNYRKTECFGHTTPTDLTERDVDAFRESLTKIDEVRRRMRSQRELIIFEHTVWLMIRKVSGKISNFSIPHGSYF